MGERLVEAEHASGWDYRWLLAVLRRRLATLALTLAIAVVLALIVTKHMTPQYAATSRVMVDPRQYNIIQSQQVLGAIAADPTAVDSQVEVIKSRPIAEEVIRTLQLQADPELAHPAKPGGALVALRRVLGLTRASPEDATGVVEAVRRRLKVSHSGVTSVIEIEFRSADPAKAARIANAFADSYIAGQLGTKLDATRKATQFLESRLEGLRQRAEASDAALKRYQAASGLVVLQSPHGDGGTAIQQEISLLNSQIATARAEQAQAEAKLSAATARPNGVAQDFGDALNSPVIQGLRKQRAEVSAKIATLSLRYGDRHPDLLSMRRQLADIDAQIAGETQRVLHSLQVDVEIARQRTRSLQDSLGQAMGSLKTANLASVNANELQSRADSDRAIYQSYLERFKETSTQEGVEQPDARVIAYAYPPRDPSSPKLALNEIIATCLGGALGLILVLAVELLENGLYGADDIERPLGLNYLGSVPMLQSLAAKGVELGSPLEHQQSHPISAFAESFRGLAASLFFARRGEADKVVMLTSALAGEGKSVTSICLGRTLAQDGLRVVLVDCDSRRRATTRALGGRPAVGLGEVILGQAPLEAALQLDAESGLAWIGITDHEVGPSLFAQARLDEVLDALRARFDIVLLDAAPVLAVAETRMLAPKADAVVMVVRWRKTPRRAVELAAKQIAFLGGRISGVILTQVDVRRQARWGYGDYHALYSAYVA